MVTVIRRIAMVDSADRHLSRIQVRKVIHKRLEEFMRAAFAFSVASRVLVFSN